MAKEYALIVAGGKGTRMAGTVPKQFMELNGKPMLLYTVEAFCRYNKNLTIILVLPEDDIDRWNALATSFGFTERVTLQAGGATRFQSVRNGLGRIDGDGLVAIHDGVRPLVSETMIAASFQLAAVDGCAVAAVNLKESIRMTEEAVRGNSNKQATSRAMDRSRFRLIQTPQTFDVSLIRDAYRMDEDPAITDDAGVAERAGYRISLYEGSFENIKVTTPEDLVIAEALLKQKS